jgi:hypothetical protein
LRLLLLITHLLAAAVRVQRVEMQSPQEQAHRLEVTAVQGLQTPSAGHRRLMLAAVAERYFPSRLAILRVRVARAVAALALWDQAGLTAPRIRAAVVAVPPPHLSAVLVALASPSSPVSPAPAGVDHALHPRNHHFDGNRPICASMDSWLCNLDADHL